MQPANQKTTNKTNYNKEQEQKQKQKQEQLQIVRSYRAH